MADLDEIRRVYEMLDENADGVVNVGELCGFINKLGISMSEDDVRSILRKPLQSEDCCSLRFEDFVEFHQYIFYSQDNEENDESKDLMEAFRVFDQNKDGYISSNELQHVLSTMGLIPGGQDPQKCEKMICRFDTDCNGVLDFSEFKSMMSSKILP
ncbi:hypothetical protein SUGI_0209590 [Cryptomeria japonica]|uniref:calmodulin-like protein 2 n=1 Tax=Cryptomeria japonica TaxID=3369 RepID=UPI002408B252|nr:calmodulin-like protein 2 [Cryptomeria japonica]GLJ13283.1 hypothetical protein SUGI_0209590 [Cryptomeria japonica]